MLKWFNIEKGKHTTKNYTVWVDTNKDNVPTEYEMYSYNTLVKIAASNKNYRLDVLHAQVVDITTGELIA